MEFSGSTLVTTPVDPALVDLTSGTAPVLSVYLTTESHVQNAALRAADRWAPLRRMAGDDGTPDEVLRVLDPLVPDAHLHGEGMVAFVDRTGAWWLEYLPEPPPRDFVQWAPLPALVPLLDHRQRAIPYVVVLTDRRGADVWAFELGETVAHAEAGGADGPETKAAPGGWSQRRYQTRAEHTWEKNATLVSEAVSSLARRIAARLVVVAGDVRAVGLLREELPPDVAALVREVPGGRAPGAGIDAVLDEAQRWVRDLAARDTVAVIERFREELGQGDRAVEGLAGTATALAEGRVHVLLIHDDGSRDRVGWFGPSPLQTALEPGELSRLGVADPVSARIVDVLVRAAVGTSAGVRVIPANAGPADGVGAVLRW